MNSDLGGQSYTPDYEVTKDDKLFALLAHLLTALCCGIGGLVIWLIKKDQSRFVAESAKHALFFWVAVFGVQVALWVITLVSAAILGPVAIILQLLTGLVGFAHLGYAILGAIRANEGKVFKYPLVGNYVK
ncbi:DUF4870 domain-containing protein [Candidatus Sumerlaeota bacterium]|nr:DUF4870 domain-containing protein [Candidatus Sumerlaeota bacterium]